MAVACISGCLRGTLSPLFWSTVCLNSLWFVQMFSFKMIGSCGRAAYLLPRADCEKDLHLPPFFPRVFFFCSGRLCFFKVGFRASSPPLSLRFCPFIDCVSTCGWCCYYSCPSDLLVKARAGAKGRSSVFAGVQGFAEVQGRVSSAALLFAAPCCYSRYEI